MKKIQEKFIAKMLTSFKQFERVALEIVAQHVESYPPLYNKRQSARLAVCL